MAYDSTGAPKKASTAPPLGSFQPAPAALRPSRGDPRRRSCPRTSISHPARSPRGLPRVCGARRRRTAIFGDALEGRSPDVHHASPPARLRRPLARPRAHACSMSTPQSSAPSRARLPAVRGTMAASPPRPPLGRRSLGCLDPLRGARTTCAGCTGRPARRWRSPLLRKAAELGASGRTDWHTPRACAWCPCLVAAAGSKSAQSLHDPPKAKDWQQSEGVLPYSCFLVPT